jgi:dipeptidyl aminopeptidase/acylaminoacyl peptidase
MEVLMKYTLILLVVCLMASCAPAPAASAPVPATPIPVKATARPTVTPYPSPTRAPTWTPEPSATPSGLIFTPDPLDAYTIPALRIRQYGGGHVENLGEMQKFERFTRFSIRYPSDGLNIAGFVNIPRGAGPFPIIVALHGYVNPAEYDTLDYTTPAADELAANGYIVLHPNYRNFPPSDAGDNLFRVGYTVDVLNLIALVRESAGKPGLFEKADGSKIGLWGHSMGGAIALKVAVINPAIKAVLLYASMSGDEQKNSNYFNELLGNDTTKREMNSSPQQFAALSPDNYYQSLDLAIQIHHGGNDTEVPASWAKETCQKLKDINRQVSCFIYDGAGHTFRTKFLELYSPRLLTFFADYLKK